MTPEELEHQDAEQYFNAHVLDSVLKARNFFEHPEILENIFQHLKPLELFRILRVGQRFRDNILGVPAIRSRMLYEPAIVSGCQERDELSVPGELRELLAKATYPCRIQLEGYSEHSDTGPLILFHSCHKWVEREKEAAASLFDADRIFEGMPCNAQGSWRDIVVSNAQNPHPWRLGVMVEWDFPNIHFVRKSLTGKITLGDAILFAREPVQNLCLANMHSEGFWVDSEGELHIRWQQDIYDSDISDDY